MDINALGIQRLNSADLSAYVPFSSAGGADSRSAFEELLKRADNASAPVSGKEPIDKTSELYELCMELETFLIKNLIKSMRSTVEKTKLIDTGFAGEIYEDMLYDEYAKSFARNAGFGFAEMAYRELSGTLR